MTADRTYPLMNRGLQLHSGVKFEGYDDQGDDRRETLDLNEAQVVTSKVRGDDVHYALLDVDMEVSPKAVALLIKAAIDVTIDEKWVTVLPSSTPGHCHVYVDRLPLGWAQLVAILDAGVTLGFVEEGYANASKARGWTSLRLPWVKKEQPAPGDRSDVPPKPEEDVWPF